MSERDAIAYEAGFSNWPTAPEPFIGPAADGWGDAEQEAKEYEQAKREVFAEREERQ